MSDKTKRGSLNSNNSTNRPAHFHRYFSMCVLNSLNLVGAAEGIVVMLSQNGWSIIDGGINDIRLIGCLLLIMIAIIPLFGMSWEAKTHHVLFVLLLVSLADYGIGTVYNITPEKVDRGLTGWNWTVISANMWPDYRYNENFYTVLAVFFPMVTGIFAGSGMSGDLKGLYHFARFKSKRSLRRSDFEVLAKSN